MDDPNMHAYGDHYQDTTADILRDVCELEPANPDLPDTVCVSVEDLKLIIDRHIEARAAVEAALRDELQAEGWVMVPLEPTQEMVDATDVGQHCTDVWKAMLAARPSAPTAVEPRPLTADENKVLRAAQWDSAEIVAPTAVEPDERAEFEAWAASEGYEVKGRDEHGAYWSSHTESAWEAWQASASKGTK